MVKFVCLLFTAITFSTLNGSQDSYPRRFEGMFQEYEGRPLDLISRFVPSDPVIFEAGGHYGEDTIRFTEKWPLSKVISFEPNPDAFKKLQNALGARNSQGIVQAHNLAVNNYNGTATLHVCYGTTGDNPVFEGASSLLEASPQMAIHYQGPKVEVPCVILDDWCTKNNIDHIDFMWLDLEGLELQVLKSSPSILATVKAIYTETNLYNFRKGMTQYKELRAFLEASGFTMLAHWYNEGLQGNAIFVKKDLLELNLHAPLDRHLKKIDAKDKIGYQGIKNVDFIYMINLDRRPEKLKLSFDQLAPYNIVPFRFSAVDGREKPLKEIAELGVTYTPAMAPILNQTQLPGGLWGTYYLEQGGLWGTYYSEQDGRHDELISTPDRNYFCHCMAKGPIAIILSHLSVLKDAYDSGYNTIWVMEDDIQVIQNPHLISSLIEELNCLIGKNSWDILFTDQDQKDKNGNYVICRSYAPRPNFSPADPARFARTQDVSSKFRKIGARYGAHSMILNRCGMKKLLDFFYRYGLFLPYDMDFCMPDGISLYTVTNDVVSNLPNALSDNH